jgi:uncharacterized protein YdeI (YjbR/CyaY-like superfamily)
MSKKEASEFYPTSKSQWRKWLELNHDRQDAVWVIFYKKKVKKPTMTWSDAVDEALCFGWIDSTKRTLDTERFIQYFSKRKPKSTWSKVNKDKVEELVETGQMTDAGLHCITVAKGNGSWEILDSVEALIIPEDLEKALASDGNAMDVFLSLSKSERKLMLYGLVVAKREETRSKRIGEIVKVVNDKIAQSKVSS